MTILKKFIVAVLCVTLCLGCVPVSAANSVQALSTDIAFERNSEPLNIETYNIDDYGFYKLRDIAAMCDGTDKEFSVKWDGERQMITLTSREDYTVSANDLQPGGGSEQTAYESNATVIVNGAIVNLTAYNINGYTYYKLRELCKALDIFVSWNETTRTSGIDTTKNYDGTDFSPSPAPEKVVLDSEEIYAKCSSSVFYIEVYDSTGAAFATGSGFFIDEYGTAVTNYHVIDGAQSAKIFLTNGEVYNVAGVYDYNAANDWAVLLIEGSGFDYLTIGDKSTIVGGAKVYALGSPLGLQDTFTDGMISNANRIQDGITYIQISAPISHGSSGGALINKYGEVIGICSAGYVEGQNLNLALPITCIDGYSRSGIITLDDLFPAQTQPDVDPGERQQLAYDVLVATINKMQTGTDADGMSPYYSEWLDDEIGIWFTDYYNSENVEVCTCYIPAGNDLEWWSFLHLTADGTSFEYSIGAYYYGTYDLAFSGEVIVDPHSDEIEFDDYIIYTDDYDEASLIDISLEMAAAMLADSLYYTDAFFLIANEDFGYPLCSVADFGFTY